jgi:hypothetical protein
MTHGAYPLVYHGGLAMEKGTSVASVVHRGIAWWWYLLGTLAAVALIVAPRPVRKKITSRIR